MIKKFYLILFAMVIFIKLSYSLDFEPHHIIVIKSEAKMYVYNEDETKEKIYNIRLGLNKGPKRCQGDKKTPEGIYHVIDKYKSKYVRFLALDYPNEQDRLMAKELGCNAGGAIGIHYYNEEYKENDFDMLGSLGCITVWNKNEILELYNLVKIGTIVAIVN